MTLPYWRTIDLCCNLLRSQNKSNLDTALRGNTVYRISVPAVPACLPFTPSPIRFRATSCPTSVRDLTGIQPPYLLIQHLKKSFATMVRNYLKGSLRTYTNNNQASASDSKKRLALAIIDFLSTSLKDGTLTSEDAESIEVAQSCIADTFHVDPSDKAAMQDAIGGQSLLSIYGVYEKLKGKSSGSAAATSSTSGTGSSTSGAAKAGNTDPSQGGTGAEAEAFKSKGNSAMAAKDYKSAIELYSKALNLSPLNPIYLSNRAAAYSASHQHAEASTDAEMAVAANPKYTKAWSRLGLARFAMGDAKGSMEAYQKGIEFEGNGGSDAMKRGYETAKKRVEEEKDATHEDEADDVESARGGAGGPGGMPDLSSLAGMFGGGGGGAGGGGGMPDLSALAGMMGGGGRGGGRGGMPDLSSIMSNPMFANMAQNLMSNPDMMNNLMSNPRLRQMAERFGGGGGGGAAAEGEGGGGGGGGVPDIASLMQDPSIAEM